MIVHLATRRGAKAVTKHLDYRPALSRRVSAIQYDQVLQRTEWPRGVYLFTDSERMTSAQKGFANWLYAEMARHPQAFVLLNHPTDHVPRFQLLRRLFEDGTNDFNVHRASEIDERVRFPIFLRYEDRHIGASTPLLRSQTEAEDALARLAAQGENVDHIIAVEFCDTADHQRLYRKYGAFRVASRIVPRHMFASEHWEVKIDTNTKSTFRRREEYAYLHGSPHEKQVMEVFEKANLQYGRMDYAIKDGRIQVWEINDNPQITSSLARYWRGRLGRCLLSLKNLDHAFTEVERAVEPGPPNRLDPRPSQVWEALCSP